ncbi:MAG: alpha/beta hydrolase fold domain-containing protein [Polyangiales bacterium]
MSSSLHRAARARVVRRGRAWVDRTLTAKRGSLCAVLFALASCTPSERIATDAGDASADAAAPSCRFEAEIASSAPPEGAVIDRLTVTILGAQRAMTLLRLPTSDGRPSYAAWIAPLQPRSPAVMMTMPYDGIDWTGEDVDQRWRQSCSQPSCLLPDRDSPNAPSDPGVIAYQYLSPQAFAEAATVHVANGAGVLGVFARFYAGGSWYSYVRAMVAGLRFLGAQPDVAPERIAVVGGSFGGFLSLYAAAYAPIGARPRAVVSLYPPADLQEQVRFSQVTAPGGARSQQRRDQFAAFFAPYLRRAEADTGPITAAVDPCFSADYIAAKVASDVFVAWDDWDMLVAPSISEGLVRRLQTRGHAMPYRHSTPPDFETLALDHGPFDRVSGEVGAYSFDTFAWAFTHLRISDGAVLVPIHPPTFERLLVRWRDELRAGRVEPAYALRLAELTDARVTLFDLTNNTRSAAASYLSRAIAQVWGVTIAPESLQSLLRAQGLPR